MTTSKNQVIELFKDKIQRLSHLYVIQDEKGKVVQFKPKPTQLRFLEEMHERNIILKARQLGFSTLIDLWILDETLFRSNTQCAILAQTRDDVQEIFEKKIKFPWQHLRSDLKSKFNETSKSANKLAFDNGSAIRVATSVRSSTLQALHISEFGYTSAHNPERARETVTGCLNTLHPNSKIFIESTAKGDEGKFFEFCDKARKLKQSKVPLTPMDYKFFFYPWFQEAAYRLKGDIIIPYELKEYFEKLKYDEKIVLDQEQMAWYSKKWADNGDDMFAEFPSTPDEAFKSTKEGRYFSRYLGKIRERGQITVVPFDESLPVFTGWDLGLSDATAIWFAQKKGFFLRLIDYYEREDESLYHHANIVKEKADKLGYTYSFHALPHDGARRSYERRDKFTRKQILEEEHGMKCRVMKAVDRQATGIELIRKSIPTLWIDEENCSVGIKAVDNYKREFDYKRGCYAEKPFHNWACLQGDTKVRTLKGWKNIKDVVAGEYVWGYSHKEGRLIPAKVERSGRTGVNCPLIEIGLDSGKSIKCTPEHKFLLRNGEYKEASKLIVGESLMPHEKKNHKVRYIKTDIEKDDVYDLCVPETGNFAAEGVIVHNSHGTKALETLLLAVESGSEGSNEMSAEEIYAMNEEHASRY